MLVNQVTAKTNDSNTAVRSAWGASEAAGVGNACVAPPEAATLAGAGAGAAKEWTAKGLAVKAVTGYFVGLAGAAAAAGIAIGKTLVDGAAFREQQVGRFTAVLGDAGKAAITFKDSILIAEKTRFAPRAVSNTLAQLIQAVGEDNAMARETAGRLMDLVTVAQCSPITDPRRPGPMSAPMSWITVQCWQWSH